MTRDMCVCVHVCVCLHVCMCERDQTVTRDMCLHVCVYVCVYVYVCVHACMCVYMCAYGKRSDSHDKRLCVSMCVCVSTCVCMCVHLTKGVRSVKPMHTLVYMDTHTYTPCLLVCKNLPALVFCHKDTMTRWSPLTFHLQNHDPYKPFRFL